MDSHARLNPTGDIYPSFECIMKLLYQWTISESLNCTSRVVPYGS